MGFQPRGGGGMTPPTPQQLLREAAQDAGPGAAGVRGQGQTFLEAARPEFSHNPTALFWVQLTPNAQV